MINFLWFKAYYIYCRSGLKLCSHWISRVARSRYRASVQEP